MNKFANSYRKPNDERNKHPDDPGQCHLCDRDGLPILPVRHAIARTDLTRSAQSDLPGNFTAQVNGFTRDMHDNKLSGNPAKSDDINAKYTLRLLRPGYLYMYDEHLKKWSGYVVNPQSYLYKFFEVPDYALNSPNYRVPYTTVDPADAINLNVHTNCRGKSNPGRLRCVCVRDATNATSIWLGFSEAPWTTAVLRQHSDSAKLKDGGKPYREAHMQHIDIKAWRDGKEHPHMMPFDSLKHIAEFGADRTTLQKQTRSYLTPFLPDVPHWDTKTMPDPDMDLAAIGYNPGPGTMQKRVITGYDKGTPEALMRSDNKALREKMPPQFQCLLPDAIPPAPPPIARNGEKPVAPPPPRNPVKVAAWAFSPFDLWLVEPPEPGEMLNWGKQFEKDCKDKFKIALRPAIAGVPDPAGIVQELNGLATYRGVELLENIDWQWQFQTACAIELVHNGVVDGMLEKDFQANVKTRQDSNDENMIAYNLLGIDPKPFTMTDAEKADWKKRIYEPKWDKEYQVKLDPNAYRKFIDKYHTDVRNAAESYVQPLDRIYVAWFGSSSFKAYFTHNFDTADVGSGMRYAQAVHNCIVQAAGRKSSMAYFKQALNQTNPDEAIHILTRAAVLNQDSLAKEVKSIAAESAKGAQINLLDVSKRTHKALQATIIAGSEHQRAGSSGPNPRVEMPLHAINRLFYQLLGPITSHIGEMINHSATTLAVKTLPQSWLLSMMAGVMQAEDPDARLVYLSSKMSADEATDMLTETIVKSTKNNLRPWLRERTQAQTQAASAVAREKLLYGGLFVVKDGGARPVPVEDFEVHIKTSISSFLSPGFKGSVISVAFSIASVLGAVRTWKKDKHSPTATLRLGAGFLSLGGDVTKLAERTLESSPQIDAIAQSFVKGIPGKAFLRNFEWVTLKGASRTLGVAGGVIAGFMDIMEGASDLHANPLYGGGMILFGSAEIMSAFMLLIEGTAAVGLILGLVIMVASIGLKLLADNAIQIWLEKCRFGKDPGFRYHSLEDQQDALKPLLTVA